MSAFDLGPESTAFQGTRRENVVSQIILSFYDIA